MILERLGSLGHRRLESAFDGTDVRVKLAAIRVLAERKTLAPMERSWLVLGLASLDPNIQRATVDALGQHPHPVHVEPLLQALARTAKEDTQLVHTLRMTLRNQLRLPEPWESLKNMTLSEDDVRRLADVSLGVPSPQAADFLMTHLGTKALASTNRSRNVQHTARYGTPEAVKTLLAFVQADRPDDLGHQNALLRAVQDGTQERGAQLAPEARPWAEAVATKLLASKDGRLLQAGLEQALTLKLASAKPRLIEIAEKKGEDENRRATAFQALIALDAKSQIAPLGQALADASESIALRERLANALAGINSTESRAELVKNLPTAPARLQNTLATGLAGSKEGAVALQDAIATGKASARLLQERQVDVRLKQTKLPMLDERLASLTNGLQPADQKLQELFAKRRSGYGTAKPDAMLGAKVFEQHCAACHQLAGKGAKVGPQLDGIGVRGLERLIEDLVDPNRNVDQAFRASLILRTDGQLVQGLLLREEGAVLVLADEKGKELRISGSDVSEKKVSTLSPMPANLIDQVPEKDFYDLLAFLLTQRAKGQP
jgi:putative heme-binding domain-containing protein